MTLKINGQLKVIRPRNFLEYKIFELFGHNFAFNQFETKIRAEILESSVQCMALSHLYRPIQFEII